MNFLIAHQLDIMLFMSGICGILAVLAMMSKSLSHRRRRIIAQLEVGAMLLLISDRQAYIYRGDTSALGFWMVRISNFAVFTGMFVLLGFGNKLLDTLLEEKDAGENKKQLKTHK